MITIHLKLFQVQRNSLFGCSKATNAKCWGLNWSLLCILYTHTLSLSLSYIRRLLYPLRWNVYDHEYSEPNLSRKFWNWVERKLHERRSWLDKLITSLPTLNPTKLNFIPSLVLVLRHFVSSWQTLQFFLELKNSKFVLATPEIYEVLTIFCYICTWEKREDYGLEKYIQNPVEKVRNLHFQRHWICKHFCWDVPPTLIVGWTFLFKILFKVLFCFCEVGGSEQNYFDVLGLNQCPFTSVIFSSLL